MTIKYVEFCSFPNPFQELRSEFCALEKSKFIHYSIYTESTEFHSIQNFRLAYNGSKYEEYSKIYDLNCYKLKFLKSR